MQKHKSQKRSVTEVDRAVGLAIKNRRVDMGVSQQELAQCLDVSFQQVQKYENGANRIPGSRLFDIAQALHSTVNDFFVDVADSQDLSGSVSRILRVNDRVKTAGADGISDRELLDAVRLFKMIKSRRLRQLITNLMRAMTVDAKE